MLEKQQAPSVMNGVVSTQYNPYIADGQPKPTIANMMMSPEMGKILVNSGMDVIKHGMNMLNKYVNNPVLSAIDKRPPELLISQEKYKGKTNLYNPIIRMNEQFNNPYDVDNFYHL